MKPIKSYKTHLWRIPASRGVPRGFALIVTLSLMILLTVIAVGLLSLSSVSLRSTSQGSATASARSNARLAMMLALGELQKKAGPDQRVTAEAAILENPSASLLSPNRHWTGVWRTDMLKSETSPAFTPLVYRETTDPSSSAPGSPAVDWDTVVDRRKDGTTYKAADQVLDWLVSNPKPEILLDPASISGETITLVGKNSANVDEQVVVPLVKTINSKNQISGSFGWWVSDDSVKARFDLIPSSQAPANTNVAQVPSRFGVGSMTGYSEYDTAGTPEKIAKTVSRKTSELLITLPAARKDRFHDVGFNSYGVIADTLSGGLKRDMSAILDQGSAAAIPNDTKRTAITTNTPLLNTVSLKTIGPRWGVLKSWSDLSNSVTGSPGSIDPIPGNIASGLAKNSFKDGTNNDNAGGVSISNQNQVAIHPILIDAGFSFGLSYKPGTAVTDPNSTTAITWNTRYHISPRVVLWNPYNVSIKSADYAVHLSGPHVVNAKVFNGSAQIKDMGGIPNNSPGIRAYMTSTADNMPYAPSFYIPGASFKPGECLLFTLPAGSATPWPALGAASNLANFALTSNTSPPLNGSYYFDLPSAFDFQAPPSAASNLNYSMGVSAPFGFQQSFSFLGLVKSTGGNAKGIFNTSSITPLQYITTTEDGALGTDLPGYKISKDAQEPRSAAVPLFKSTDMVNFRPYYRAKWGQRFAWLQETAENRAVGLAGGGALANIYNTPFINFNQLMNNNLRSSWHMRSPVEVVMRVSGGSGRICIGNMIDDPLSWDYSDPTFDPVPSGGKNRVSPFLAAGLSGGVNYPIYQIPSRENPVLSIAMLQHVPLSIFPWHPGYAIGNSLADPRVPRDKTVNYVSTGNWIFNGGGHTNDWNTVRQMNVDSTLDAQNWLYDLSYESNRELWDKYFLSSIKSGTTLSASVPLPNPRISYAGNPQGAGIPAKLRDANQAASQLYISGAFNVNSVSEQAWKSLLLSFRANPAIELTLNNGSKVNAGAVFSRLVSPVGGEYGNEGAESEEMWNGYRRLTDTQIAALSKEIVVEVKRRGPFLSLADFVNRRLVIPPSNSGAETDFTKTGLKGALQTAIDRAKINDAVVGDPNSPPAAVDPANFGANNAVAPYYQIPKAEYDSRERFTGGKGNQILYGVPYPQITYPVANGYADRFGTKPDHNHWADSKLTGSPACLMQADVLQKVGPVLASRGDTFTIRTYGESRDASNKVLARAWAEATVQRTPEPLEPDANGLDPDKSKPLGQFGRKFILVSFRWLSPDEI
ncbi:MAG: hypothetical protein ABI600_06000 [Luteolibacter sp.]